MSVPDFQAFMLPLMRRCADGHGHALAEFRAQLAADMDISEADRKEKLPSGAQTKYDNRITWAAIYLHRAGCLERLRRRVFRITARGQQVLSEKPNRITVELLSQFPEFELFRQGKPLTAVNGPTPRPAADDGQTPEEILETSFQELQNALANDILDAVKKMSPEAFEQLVVRLLVAMGYGGSIQDAGRTVGKSGDERIDGIIKEDKLGLDVMCIQAKKWESVVGRPFVQGFAGSLEGQRA
jgi:restriction system protein